MATTACAALAAGAAPAGAALKVSWMPGFNAAGTPAKYNKVGVIKVGPAKAKNVLVLEPGTSAGGTYFVPLAQWIVAKSKGWQVWSVERRENLLEDQSYVDLAKERRITATQLFNYYLGYLSNPSISPHYQGVNAASVAFADNWGMRVAVEDLHRVIASARKLGGRVVLGGHSLGGSVVTAYATWNFGGKAGARDLNGLVYIDGGSGPSAIPVAAANKALSDLHAGTPWLTFGTFPAPLAGTFNVTGSLGALLAPNAPSVGQASGIIPPFLRPSVPVTNLAQYGYALNVGTSPASLVAAQGHLGKGVVPGGSAPHGWDSTGALTPIKRFAQMFSGQGILHADGTEWFFPQRLTDDAGAVDEGKANPAQSVLDVRATMGHSLPRSLLIYAFGAALGGARVLTAATLLAQQSHIPLKNLTLINRQSTYAHNDPAGAYPHNVFFSNLLPFLKKVAAQKHA
jgi:pimeloyl-ACP methyl ester carboxylesterase